MKTRKRKRKRRPGTKRSKSITFIWQRSRCGNSNEKTLAEEGGRRQGQRALCVVLAI